MQYRQDKVRWTLPQPLRQGDQRGVQTPQQALSCVAASVGVTLLTRTFAHVHVHVQPLPGPTPALL